MRLAGDKGYLTIKGISVGASRKEFEYEIPAIDATEMLNEFTSSELSKTRYKIKHAGKMWEVDEFHGNNEGLLMAEIELNSENENFELPEWILNDVTVEEKYYNSNLSINPYKNW